MRVTNNCIRLTAGVWISTFCVFAVFLHLINIHIIRRGRIKIRVKVSLLVINARFFVEFHGAGVRGQKSIGQRPITVTGAHPHSVRGEKLPASDEARVNWEVAILVQWSLIGGTEPFPLACVLCSGWPKINTGQLRGVTR